MGKKKQLTWYKWKKQVYGECPVATRDRKLCRPSICPCRRHKLHQMDEWCATRLEPWFSTGAGTIGGMVKFTRLLKRGKSKNGNG